MLLFFNYKETHSAAGNSESFFFLLLDNLKVDMIQEYVQFLLLSMYRFTSKDISLSVLKTAKAAEWETCGFAV